MGRLKKLLLMAFVLVMLIPVSVLAQEERKEEQKGSIHVNLSDAGDGTQKGGIRFQCIKVAEIENGKYILNKEYEGLKIDLNLIETSEQMAKAAEKLEKYCVEERYYAADEEGKIEIENLEVGVYLLKAEDNENYDKIVSSLVMIPMWDEVTKEMQYDISVFPKHAKRSNTNHPQTGVQENFYVYLAAGVVSMIIILCRKRWYRQG